MKSVHFVYPLDESFAAIQKALVEAIVELANPSMIYLLGLKFSRKRTESIFQLSAPAIQQVSGYFLLVLLKDMAKADKHQWQERIENKAKAVISTTTIVLLKNEFEQWLKQEQLFAVRVRQSGTLIYDAEDGDVAFDGPEKTIDYEGPDWRCLEQGLIRARAFLSGSELFRIQHHHNIAAFMLHQSVEHALHVLIKARMGYYANTHNLERLFNYAGFVYPKLSDVFARESEEDKRIFMLLHKAYVDARYSDHYRISSKELLVLTEKARLLHELLSDTKKQDMPEKLQSIS